MTLNEKIKQIEALSKKMEGFMKTTMPRLAGRLAINHFESNFIKGGWPDGSLTAWKTTVRQKLGGGNAERWFNPVPIDDDGTVYPKENRNLYAGDRYVVFNISLPQAYVCGDTTQTGASWDMFPRCGQIPV